jgi:ABC-type lipoprotein release transport system permease subunit
MGVGSASRERHGIGSRVEPNGPVPPRNDRNLWRGQRASLLSGAGLARTRLGNSWRLLLAVGIGIIVAVVLICTVPLYNTLVANIQLQAKINSEGPAGRNVEIQVTSDGFSALQRRAEDDTVRTLSGQYLASFAQPDVNNYLTADPMLLAALGARQYELGLINAAQVQFEAFDYAQARSHMQLAPGSALPQPPQAGVNTPYDALVTRQMANDQGIKIGDRLVTAEFGAHNRQIVARVVGIWSPTDPEDGFWNGRQFDVVHSDVPPLLPAVYPVLLDRDALTQAISSVPDLGVTQHWVSYTVPTRVSTNNMANVSSNIHLLQSHLTGSITDPGVHVAVATGLVGTIADMQRQLALLGLPTYMIVGQVVGLALLFVAAMAGLLVDRQAGEIATLKSRGASGAQILGSYAVQGLLLGGLAVVAGPFLAAALALALVRWFVPTASATTAGASGSYLASLATPATVAAPALAGALLGAAAVVAAAQRAARLDALAFRREQGRATRQPFWRRYYLDVGLAIVCALGYLELGQFGGLQTRQLLGQGTSSLLLLAAPGLLLLAGALLLLRLFPLVAAAGARVAARGRGATGMLAFAQVARSPAGPYRLALLLALGAGLGLFALTFDASLVRSASDRAAYQVGSDLRLVENASELPSVDARIQQQLATLPAVRGLTAVYRNSVSTTIDEGGITVDLLAVDPATWQRVAGGTSWRSDYADASLATLMAGLRTHQHGNSAADRAGQTGAGAPSHPVWALVSQTFASDLSLKVGDRFAMELPGAAGTSSFFVVGAIVQDFPTVYPALAPGGFMVVDLYEGLGAIQVATQGNMTQQGPNEYWLQTSDDGTQRTALARALVQQAANLDISHVEDRRAVEASIASNPVQAGMRGLLTVGALIAAALAVLGSVVQSTLAARQRVVQFAVWRTLGMASRQLVALLLSEQLVVYAFGLLGGTLLGLVLVTATLPYLQFSDTTIDPAKLGVPPYVLAINVVGMLEFYAILLGAFAVALLVAARYAATVGLGKTLRLGED